jgi:hypothetical protein
MIAGPPGNERPVDILSEFIPLGCNQLHGAPEYWTGLQEHQAGWQEPRNQILAEFNIRRVNIMNATNEKPTVVMIHGAWADGTRWKQAIEPLQSRGVATVAAPIPLTSLSDDVQALDTAHRR